MAVLFTPFFTYFTDDNGNPLSGGKLYTYEAGTTTPKATYTTAAATVPNANPVILDSSGRAVIFIDGSYRFDLYTSADVLIRSVDNITNFTTTGDAEDAFFETFSGDGSTKIFTLSEDLGTDEKVIMAFTEFEYTLNGDFATDSDWTKGTGWSIGSGVATATGAISTDLEQDAARTLVEGELYTITMTITRSAGSITPNIGGTAGTARSSSGTYTENIIAGSTQKITFSTSGFTGTVDNVTVTKVSGEEYVSTALYTLNGTSLTFTIAPASGSNNIKVTAPSRLAGAASASAAAAAADAADAATSAADAETAQTAAETAQTNAETAETNAEAAAVEAAAQAAKLSGTSTTSLAIGTGAKVFTTQADKFFDAGSYLLITSDADPSNYMHGQVTSYSGTTLTMNITNTGGSGTLADWTIRVSGTRGAIGATGPAGGPLSDGDYGDITVSGTGTVFTIDNNAVTAAKISSGAATDGQVLTADGSGNSAWESISAANPLEGGYAAGRYYYGWMKTASVGATMAANTLTATPFVITEEDTFTGIGIDVTSTSTGSARIGIYTCVNGVPADLVIDAGTVSVTFTGEKTITTSQVLTPGIYFSAIVTDGTPDIRFADGGNDYYEGLFGVADAAGTVGVASVTVAHTFGALPSTFGSVTYASAEAPSIYLKVS